MRESCLVFMIIVCFSFASFAAKTPQQLIKEFSDFLGPGKYARLVWQREKGDGYKCNMCADTDAEILALDTKDGVVRTLVPLETRRHYSSPTFTWDGKKVIFYENYNYKVYSINWDGTDKREILSGYEGNGYCWRSADGKNWVLATQYPAGQTGAKLQRVNIDNPAEKVDILTCTWKDLGWAGATAWVSMSVDGKEVTGGFPNYNGLAWLTVGKTAEDLEWFYCNGCWPTISRDNRYYCLYTCDPNAHKEIVIIDRRQTVILRKNISSALGGPNNLFEALRWTMDSDYLTCYAYKGVLSTIGVPNPRLIRISDLAWVAIDDSPTRSQGNMDVFFYSDNTEATSEPVIRQNRLKAVVASTQARSYDMRGRRLVSGIDAAGEVRIVEAAGIFHNISFTLRRK